MLSIFGSQSDAWVTLFTVTDLHVRCTVLMSWNLVEFCASSLESLGSRRKDFPVPQTCQRTPALGCLVAIKLPPTPRKGFVDAQLSLCEALRWSLGPESWLWTFLGILSVE